MHDDSYFMRLALEQAGLCGEDVPVGAVVVKDGQVVSVGRNRREELGQAALHAEIDAINGACSALSGWNLSGCAMYVTLEPCPMCAGAIILSRISRLVFGAVDEKGGACGSVCDLFAMPFNWAPSVLSGVMADDCKKLLDEFFKKIR